MQLLSPDSKFAQVMTSVGEMMLLNICWILASLPLFTIGAANAAMYTVLGRRLRSEGSGTVVPFFKAFRKNLKMGTLFWVAQAFISVSLTMILVLPLPKLLKGIAAVLLVLVTAVLGLIYPQIARFRNRWFSYLRNGVILLVLKFGWVMLNLLLILLPVLLFLLMPVEFLRWSVLWLLFGFSLLFYLSAKLMVKILQPLEALAAH
ncbi:MAG: YesL family protein [Oscillospiraceae bacterium]|nr:YesL family protein [Oscillospiraceae bacterium]